MLISCVLLSCQIVYIYFTYINFTVLCWFSKKYGLINQAVLTHCSAINFLSIWECISITAFCIIICTAGRRLSSFKLLCNLFGIIPIAGSKKITLRSDIPVVCYKYKKSKNSRQNTTNGILAKWLIYH